MNPPGAAGKSSISLSSDSHSMRMSWTPFEGSRDVANRLESKFTTRRSHGLNCLMTLRFDVVLTPPPRSAPSMAWSSPTERPYGPRPLVPNSRAARSLSPPQRSGHCLVSAPRGLLRRCQGHLGGAIRKKIRLLERLRRHGCGSLPRLWSRGSGVRSTQMRCMWKRALAHAQLQTKGCLSVM